MKRFITVLAVLLLYGTAWGQIKVPAEIEPYKFVDATLEAVIPDGAYLADGGWDVIGEEIGQVADIRANGNKLSFVGPPGKYSIVYDGVILMDVTFKDGAGNDITVRNYLGKAKGRAVCVIKGATPPVPPIPPDPPPPPPPPPGGPWQIVMFYDAGQLDNYPQSQRDLLTSLALRKKFQEAGHDLLEILESTAVNSGTVVPRLEPWCRSVKGKPFPRIALAPIAGGTIQQFPLPSDEAALLELLRSTPMPEVKR